jgi:thiol-disulfide isomerase/thioredoxin
MEPPRPSSSAAMTAEAGPGHITQASAPTIMPGQRPKARLDFTLYDLSGRPWNFRNHSGKLVLVDFWATTCVHCIHAMPKVIELQSRYRQDGLEVVGIACEAPSDFVSQVTAVEKVKLRFADSKAPINYPMYLEGTNFEGRVQKLFGIRAYPTMILLDEYGRQLWRSDRKESTGLEEAIRYYLSK